ncbi:PQQ-binding-like beta-propeller repeat protein [candidate division WOR-3 bacterium]|nr:PQQ-binding-like beta-propeller repeat protein [candidate division WOR-3 bacterium]
MKKVLVLSVCLIGILIADWKRVMGSSDAPLAPEKEVMKSDTLGVFIRTAVFGFNEQDTTVDNKDFKRITIPEELIDQDTVRAGKPQIPYIRLLIAVPDSCDFDITVYESDYTLFEDYLIYPIPRIVFEETSGCFYSKEVYTYDATFYQKDTLYPGKFYEVNSDGHWRDQRVLEVFLYPVQFNPGQKLMYFYTNFNLRLEYSGEVVVNENGLGPFEDIGRDILLNYSGIDWEPESVPEPAVHYYTKLDTNNVADYIIVTHLDFITEGVAQYWIDQFAQWRVDHNQFDVGIVKIQDIYEQFDSLAPDSAAQLRDFLIYAYNNWYASSMPDNHFAYCLFIGDWDYVPTLLFTYWDDPEWLGANEFYFAEFNSDNFADIMLGRWPVKQTNVQDLVTIAQKTINYEKYPVQVDSFRRRGLLIAGDTCFERHIDSSKSYFSDIGYDTITIRPSQIGQDQPFIDSVNKYLNQGEILTSYFGHGGPEAWMNGYDTTEVKDLTNSNRLPVVLSNSCLTAMFQWDHPFYDSTPPQGYPAGISLGEHFLINPDGGAVAFWGATTYTVMPNYKRVLKMLLRYQHWILGEFTYIQGSAAGWGAYNMWCLLGDPALDLGDYTAFPDLPDLVVRPQGIDISILPPYPYPAGGDEIPIRAKVLNFGATPTYNIDVEFKIVLDEDTIYNNTVVIDEIKPRCSVDTTVYWNTALTHPGYYGEIGDCDFIVIADPEDVIEESWEYNNKSSITKEVNLYPNQPGWPKKVTGFTQPAIANLDGEGSVEIVYPGDDSIYVFNYDGSIFDGWPKYFKGVHGIVLGNVDENDVIEVVAVSPESIKVYNYQGNILYDWPVQHPDTANYVYTGLPALGRIEIGVGSNLNIVVVSSPKFDEIPGSPTPLKIFVYDFNGNLNREFNTSYDVVNPTFPNGLSISDVNGGGNNEVIISYFDPETGPARTEIFNHFGSDTTLNYGSNHMISALVDLDNDGYAEVITGGRDKKIRAYKATTGQTLWERETGGAINSSPAVGDIHPAPQYPGVEITFGNYASEIHLREKDYGDNISPWPDTVGGLVKTSPAIANISGDKYLDIIVGANNRYIYAFKHTMERILPYPLPLFGKPSSPVIGDIDGDRKSEIILASNDGYLHIWENIDSKVLPYSLEWPQFHHDYQRTGLYGWVGGLRGGDANPKEFSTGTTLSFTLEDNLHTKIKIYDAEANLVKNLVNQTLPQGTHNLTWFGKDNNYAFLPNGIYFIEIKVKNESKIIPIEINR